ncbi:MAG: caspase family protein [Rhodoferax sp.]|nr:caspase family protein [Rhodoferax sp.]
MSNRLPTHLARVAKTQFWLFILLLVGFGFGVLAPAALAQNSSSKRIALVIGNDNYQHVSKLQKAGNDAKAMARELKGAGFEVLLHQDLNYRGMLKAVATLAGRIAGGDQVLVFFAGHGVQTKSGSFLLPVDIEIGSESEVEKTAYSLNDLTDQLNEAKASFALVMVDACRDNPLKVNGRSVGAVRGLSAIEPPKGQMVVYSASKGQQALDRLSDSDNNPNGVFTREFIAKMRQPGVRIEDLMREVQDAVETLAKQVGHDQRPAIYNEARGNFYFFGPTAVQLPGTDPEAQTWAAAERAHSAPAYLAYLNAYPGGRYAVAAKIALDAVKTTGSSTATATVLPTARPAASEDPETALWNAFKSSDSRDRLDAYQTQYPSGKYQMLAKVARKRLDDQDKAGKPGLPLTLEAQPRFDIGDKWTFRYQDSRNRKDPYLYTHQAYKSEAASGWLYGETQNSTSKRQQFILRYDYQRGGVKESFEFLAGSPKLPGQRYSNLMKRDDSVQFPLSVGKKYAVKRVFDNGGGYFEYAVEVVAYEKVKVEAGEFDAYRIKQSGTWHKSTEPVNSGPAEETRWFAPKAKQIVKSEGFTRTAAGRQFDMATTELVKWEPKAALPVGFN